MTNIKSFTLIALALFSFSIAFAETQNESEKKLSLDEGTIDSQFEYVIKKSNNYQDFEVIKKSWVHRLRNHVNDSLKMVATQLQTSNRAIETQKAEIEALKSELSQVNGNLNEISTEKNSMSFFGLLINKNAYNATMWGIIIGLIALLSFFIVRFKASNIITQQSKQDFEELQYEFESYRKRALEREQKIKRELQDERNKQLV